MVQCRGSSKYSKPSADLRTSLTQYEPTLLASLLLPPHWLSPTLHHLLAEHSNAFHFIIVAASLLLLAALPPALAAPKVEKKDVCQIPQQQADEEDCIVVLKITRASGLLHGLADDYYVQYQPPQCSPCVGEEGGSKHCLPLYHGCDKLAPHNLVIAGTWRHGSYPQKLWWPCETDLRLWQMQLLRQQGVLEARNWRHWGLWGYNQIVDKAFGARKWFCQCVHAPELVYSIQSIHVSCVGHALSSNTYHHQWYGITQFILFLSSHLNLACLLC